MVRRPDDDEWKFMPELPDVPDFVFGEEQIRMLENEPRDNILGPFEQWTCIRSHKISSEEMQKFEAWQNTHGIFARQLVQASIDSKREDEERDE